LPKQEKKKFLKSEEKFRSQWIKLGKRFHQKRKKGNGTLYTVEEEFCFQEDLMGSIPHEHIGMPCPICEYWECMCTPTQIELAMAMNFNGNWPPNNTKITKK